MSKAVEEVLSAWRDAERVLEVLPEVGRDHEDVVVAVTRLRATYQALTDVDHASQTAIRSSRATVEDTRDLLARIRERGRD